MTDLRFNTHPDHADRVRLIGTLAGHEVRRIALDSAERPWLPRSVVHFNSGQSWVKIGSGWWTPLDRARRLELWLNPPDSPWCVGDLDGLLDLLDLPDVDDADWPGGHPPDWRHIEADKDRHWREVLPAARASVRRRYLAAMGVTP